ncbi:MAG: RNA-guided endonuclease TnpB family protein [Halobacteriota archaeon]
MLLTHKVKHNQNLTQELLAAKSIANYVVHNQPFFGDIETELKQFGLRNILASQIAKKYKKLRNAKKVKNVNLVVPKRGIKINKKMGTIYIPSLRLNLYYYFPHNFERITQIELNEEHAFISTVVTENSRMDAKNWIGVDRNTTGHVAVVADLRSGAVTKLGRSLPHMYRKYANIKTKLQKTGKHKKLKKVKSREKQIMQDLNHKISRKIVNIARNTDSGIKLENIRGIKKLPDPSNPSHYSLDNWTFYQMEQFILYKARLLGIPVTYVDPANTSKICSRCGAKGNRTRKSFTCPSCGHVDHADALAAFNIAGKAPIGNESIHRRKRCGGRESRRPSSGRHHKARKLAASTSVSSTSNDLSSFFNIL